MRLSNTAAKVIFTTTALVLLTISYILYQQVRSLVRSQEQVSEKYLVKMKLQETLSLLKDAEAAQRGYLLTQDSLFLQPYNGARVGSQRLLADLRSYMRDNGEEDLNALQTFIELRFNTFRQVIDHYNAPDISAETRKNHLLRGQSILDSIARYTAIIEAKEDKLVREREQDKKSYLLITPFFAILLILVSISILIFSYSKIIEHLNRSRKLLARLKKMNQKLREQNHELELSNRELDSFTFIASHDLKEPLRKILTYTEFIETNDHFRLSETSKAHFKRVRHAAFRMRNLLDDLIAYSRVNVSEKKQLEHVSLDKVLEDVICDMSEELRQAHVAIHAGPLPVIKGLPFQLKQLFTNLISNSIKYRREETPPSINIESSLVEKKEIIEHFPKTSETYCRLTLSDNGMGFEQHYSEKIFQLFQRLHGSKKDGGTGIGLTICKKIIDNHRGFIKAVSKVNEGTTFEIYLPVE